MRFSVIGGDGRQLWLACALERQGHTVLLSCLGEGGLPPAQAMEESEAVVLPLPVTRDGNTLHAPLVRQQPPPLDDDFAGLCRGKTVLGGMVEPLRRTSALWQEIDLRDYYAREELLQGNAVLTAEAALGLIALEWPGGFLGARALVAGYGRIGKALCARMSALGTQVACAARKPADLAAIRACGWQALSYAELEEPYDLVCNTVPAPVLGEGFLARQGEAYLLELASAPGGFDQTTVERLGLSVRQAPGLPGRYAPRAAGELLQRTITSMLDEG